MALKWLQENRKAFLIGSACATITTLSSVYFAFNLYRKSYPEFTSLPGPFKHISTSYHRIPGNTRFKLFYPTNADNIESSGSTHPVTYQKSPETFQSLGTINGIPMFVLNALNDLSSSKYCPFYHNAPVAAVSESKDSKYPLLVFSHGNFSGFDFYNEFCCGMASYGLIVAIADHTDSSALYTEMVDGNDRFYEGGHLIDESGQKYKPSPWTEEHDVLDYGQRLKNIRVPEFKALYRYLRSGQFGDDNILREVSLTADFENVIFGGQSFGGVTSWMAARDLQNREELKCMVLLDPWFGCIDKKELRTMKWTVPCYAMSSEQWMNTKPHATGCTRIVMGNGPRALHWEYAKRSKHIDYSDASIWGPSFMTSLRKGYSAQEWKDLQVKRCMSFVVEHVPEMKTWIGDEDLKYDRFSLVSCE